MVSIAEDAGRIQYFIELSTELRVVVAHHIFRCEAHVFGYHLNALGLSAGLASRFVDQQESLGIVQEFAGTISGEVDGTPYVGDFKEEPHGDHEHE